MSEPHVAPANLNELPPLAPPSGRHIVQMFVAPALIVLLAVGALLLVSSFRGMFGNRSIEAILRDLDDANPEVRWRAASDLAERLPRDPNLARNSTVALELTEKLRRAVQDNRVSERLRAEQLSASKTPTPLPKALQAERDHIWYLIGCLGNFQVPVAAPLLQELALNRDGGEVEAVFRRRTQAAYALSVLGFQVRKLDQLSADERAALLAALAQEPADSERGQWAALTGKYLEARFAGQPPPTLRVADTLVKLAAEEAPFLRQLAATGFSYWDNEQAEDVLFRLVHDQGQGEDPIVYEADIAAYRQANPEEMRRRNRRGISYGAALALARRGSPRAAELFDLYEEMLDPERQAVIWHSNDPSQAGAATASGLELISKTLTALSELKSRRPAIDFNPAALDRLLQSDNVTVRTNALELRNKLK